MVQVTSYAVRERKDGTTFITLELTGSLELVQSQNGSSFYATIRKCSIPSTFDEPIAKMMIGQQLDGDIVRVSAQPYEFINKRTGEVMQLAHSYAFQQKGSVTTIGHTQVTDLQLAEN